MESGHRANTADIEDTAREEHHAEALHYWRELAIEKAEKLKQCNPETIETRRQSIQSVEYWKIEAKFFSEEIKKLDIQKWHRRRPLCKETGKPVPESDPESAC
jgi:hypothetical protein